jgi:hypothetical protein
MNRQTQIGILFGTVLVMVCMVWLFSSGGEQSILNAKKKRAPFISSDWVQKYQINDKNPLGLYLFTKLTQAHLDRKHHVKVINDGFDLDSLQLNDSTQKSYVFVGKNFGMDEVDLDSILSDVKRGSSLFISFDDLYEEHYEQIFDSVEFLYDFEEKVNVRARRQSFNMVNIFQNDTVATKWWGFTNYGFQGASQVLSSIMEVPNFLKVEHGNGFLYLHTNPIMFHNYQLKRKEGFEHTAFVLENIPRNQDVHYLELARLPDEDGDFPIEDEGESPLEKQDDSLLQLIFREPSLLAALLLSILGLILFVIFRSKRTRPVVPFIPKKKNMTMAFAETITSIYLSKRNPYGLLQVQRKNFYDTVQRYFFVDLSHRDGDRELEMLSEKSNTPLRDIKAMVARLETTEATLVSEEYIAQLAKEKHAFYRRVGIISDKLVERFQRDELVFKRTLWLPILFIVLGVFITLAGLYLLTISVGVGILLWPNGMIMLILGIIRLSNPYFAITKEHMTYYSVLGRKRMFNRADLVSTEVRGTGVIFNFNENGKMIINYWDLSAFDRAQFERFISKLQIQEL